MKFVNLNNKDVVVKKESGSIRFIAQEHSYFKIEKKIEKLNEMEGVPVTSVTYRTLGKLPKRKVGTIYIVPRVVASRNPGRDDLFIPDGITDRSNGEIVCRSISLY